MTSEEAVRAAATARSAGSTGRPERGGRSGAVRALVLIALSTLLSMSVWFSASFVVPQLTELWQLGPAQASLLTIAVQAGFVTGALTLAATGLADAVPSRRLMGLGALGAAAVNLGLLFAPGVDVALVLRFLTGMLLAAVYPPALKEVSTWFRRGRGKALGVMIGALTLGSALPHLVNAGGGLDWRLVITATTVLTAGGGLLVLLIRGSGPYPFPRSVLRLSAAVKALRSRPVVLANVGYAGHMWELYAMWAWVGAFLASLEPFATGQDGRVRASLAAFACIGAGAVGCMLGGVLSDRYGRARAALTSLVLSGGAALALAFGRGLPLPVVLGICLFWGFWVVADSAQFSALVTEHADPRYVGSAVSLQLGIGYTTTTVTLWLVPVLAERYSWTPALAVLAAGPLVGAAAMVELLRRGTGGTPSAPAG